MADLGVWVVSRGGGGAPESARTAPAPAMEMAQVQKEAMASHQHPPPLFLDFAHGGDCGGGGGRKRQREAEAVAVSPQLFSLQPHAQVPKAIGGLEQLRKRSATGFRLDFDEGLSGHVSTTSAASASCLLSDEVAARRDQGRNEMDRLIQEHAERLRRALADMRLRQYRSLLGAAEAVAGRRIREKEAEATEAARRGMEMEERVARMRAEAAAWQAKALADQSTAAALHAKLQHAQARCKAEEEGDGAAGDAGSCFVDPDRVVEVAPPPPIARPCRTCARRAAAVLLLPCRHLCVCAACEPALSAGGAACPMCRGAVTGIVQVFF